jgi:hypothetical protein
MKLQHGGPLALAVVAAAVALLALAQFGLGRWIGDLFVSALSVMVTLIARLFAG